MRGGKDRVNDVLVDLSGNRAEMVSRFAGYRYGVSRGIGESGTALTCPIRWKRW
jgi:hypothetical protein